jgi:lipopolysaccharide/colanic/teichoic acid biosynthesis glycosyltransferase
MKRFFDVVVAAGLGVLALPALALSLLAIRWETGRPVFFVQIRAGRYGKPFRIFKLRTLHTGLHDPKHPERQATAVGRWLRRYALDELPQLWNVMRGDMSLVGPRPILVPEARAYDDGQRRRLDVRPGLTGWAQIHGRNALPWQTRIRYDLWYVKHRSLWLDLYILWKTPGVLLRGTGVYGPGTQDPSPEDVHRARAASSSNG